MMQNPIEDLLPSEAREAQAAVETKLDVATNVCVVESERWVTGYTWPQALVAGMHRDYFGEEGRPGAIATGLALEGFVAAKWPRPGTPEAVVGVPCEDKLREAMRCELAALWRAVFRFTPVGDGTPFFVAHSHLCRAEMAALGAAADAFAGARALGGYHGEAARKARCLFLGCATQKDATFGFLEKSDAGDRPLPDNHPDVVLVREGVAAIFGRCRRVDRVLEKRGAFWKAPAELILEEPDVDESPEVLAPKLPWWRWIVGWHRMAKPHHAPRAHKVTLQAYVGAVGHAPAAPHFRPLLKRYRDFCRAQVAALRAATSECDAAVATCEKAFADLGGRLAKVRSQIKTEQEGATVVNEKLGTFRATLEHSARILASP